MKNFKLTFFSFLLTSLSATAQFVETARIASDGTRITASGDNNRGAAFNAGTNNYLVATRTATTPSKYSPIFTYICPLIH